MKRKIVLGILLSLIFVGSLTLAFNIQPVKATIYVTSDFDFVGNIFEPIVVLVDNIVIDGKGFTLQGTGSGIGIYLNGRNNVTVKNLTITQFEYGIHLNGSSNNGIVGNTMTNSYRGVILTFSSNNTVSENTITNTDYGISLNHSSNNTISGNTIANNPEGVYVGGGSNNAISGNNITDSNLFGVYINGSSNNTISGNNITENSNLGVYLWGSANNNTFSENNITNSYRGVSIRRSSDNRFFHNNLIDNTQQVFLAESGYANFWDDGYPSGGNYWSDYSIRYPGAQELDGSGIWDMTYVIDDFNQDNYPLMDPWEVPLVGDTEAYIEYIDEAIQELPDEMFGRPGEDVPDVKNDFSELFDDALENIGEENYQGAIEKLNRIKEKIREEMVESIQRQKLILLIDDLIEYLETLL